MSEAAASRSYPARPIVGIGIAVLRPGAVLLVRRANPPNAGTWSLPGGGQELGETAEDAARRELREEAGLEVGEVHLAANVDSIHRDADGQVQWHYTIIDFCAAYRGGEPAPGGDVTAAIWAPLDGLDAYDLWSEAKRVIAAAGVILGIETASHAV